MRPIVAGYAAYSGTKKAYCAQHDLNPHTLDYWRKRIQTIDADTPTAQDKPSKSKKQSSFVELPPLAVAPASLYTLHFPDGKRLELPLQTPLEMLSALLQLSV